LSPRREDTGPVKIDKTKAGKTVSKEDPTKNFQTLLSLNKLLLNVYLFAV